MILVLLGTQNNDFSRLLFQIESCIEKKIITDKVIVQAGHTKFDSDEMEIFDFIPKEEMDKLICSADFIITHGGVGSIMQGIKANKKVIAVPRLMRFKEHVNDHQIQIIKNLSDLGYIKGVLDIDNLPSVLQNIDQFIPNHFENKDSKIQELVSTYIDNN